MDKKQIRWERNCLGRIEPERFLKRGDLCIIRDMDTGKKEFIGNYVGRYFNEELISPMLRFKSGDDRFEMMHDSIIYRVHKQKK